MRKPAFVLGLVLIVACGFLFADDALLQHLTRQRDFLQSEIDRLSQVSAESETSLEPVAGIAELNLEYLGAFLPPAADPAQTAVSPHFKFNYSDARAALGPDGLFLQGQGHSVCEISLDRLGPGDNPPRARYLQPFADLGAGGRKEHFKAALIRSLLYSKRDRRLYVAWGQNYNVAHAQYPTLCWGPPELARHVADGTDVLWVTDEKGERVDHELVAGYMAETSLGFVLAQQQGKHQARSDGPCLYVVDKPDDGAQVVTGFRRLLAYPRESYLFPDPPWVDGTGGWTEESLGEAVAEIDGLIVFGGRAGLGTGLENFQPYSTGTIEIRNGVVTLTGGVFPAWIGSGKLHFAGGHRDGEVFESRDSDTQATLVGRSHNASDGTAYTVSWGPRGAGVRRNSYYGPPKNYPVEGVNICKGPSAKGYHSPPYEGRLWFFKAQTIAEAQRPSDPMPYAVVNLSTPEFLGENDGCGQIISAICWDAATRRLYLVERAGGRRNGEPLIHVLAVKP